MGLSLEGTEAVVRRACASLSPQPEDTSLTLLAEETSEERFLRLWATSISLGEVVSAGVRGGASFLCVSQHSPGE